MFQQMKGINDMKTNAALLAVAVFVGGFMISSCGRTESDVEKDIIAFLEKENKKDGVDARDAKLPEISEIKKVGENEYTAVVTSFLGKDSFSAPIRITYENGEAKIKPDEKAPPSFF